MNLSRLILQNIRHYARSWLLTLIGAVIGTAVLTGALITGDSVRYSLIKLVSRRLGEARFALAPADRFFRQALANELDAYSGFRVYSLLRTTGIVTEPGQKLTLNKVEVIGVNKDFSRLWSIADDTCGFITPAEDEAVISANVASRLKVKPGDFIVLKISKEGSAPANAPFVSERSETSGIRLKIRAVAGDRTGGYFSLDRNQSAPFNIFVSQKKLALKMGMAGFANTLLVATKNSQVTADTLNNLLQLVWKPADAGLLVTELHPGLTQLTSRRIFIEDTLANAIMKDEVSGILTYLVNDIAFHGRSTPYSFVTAASPGVSHTDPDPGEIVITDWLARDLDAKTGDSLTLRYWVMGANRSLSEVSARFVVHLVVPVGKTAADRALMPDFPGMKNTGNCRDWETGTPVNLDRIRDKDEQYWNFYRGTPKAWVSMADGQRIWKNPFGRYTAFRFGSDSVNQKLTKSIREVDPSALGLIFTPVFEEGMRAAGNSTDLGELFLSFGGLISIAGLMLSGMLLSFFLQQRVEEVVLLRSMGFRNRKIMSIFLPETFIVSVTGGLLGVIAAIIYAQLIVTGLNTLWQGAVNTSGLAISIRSTTLIAGFLAGMILNMIVFAIILYRNRNRSLPSPYRQKEPVIPKRSKLRKLLSVLLPVAIFASAVVIILFECLSGRFYPSPAFMISGVLVMAGIIACITYYLSWKSTQEPGTNATFSDYALKNAVLQKTPTLTAITLLALGTFMILVTGLNRRSGSTNEDHPGSGTGGFLLWMETTLPVFADLNTPEGRTKSGLENMPGNIRFVPLPGVLGDDASCLNLNQVTKPGLTGVPSKLFDVRESFSFANLANGIDRAHPWKALEQVNSPWCINGFADQTVITWGLRKQTGDTLHYTDEIGRQLNIRLAGGLENSVFQGSLLISDSLLRLHFPSSERTRNILIDAPAESGSKLTNTLEDRLRDQGAVVIPAEQRLANFEVVENTYLDIFIMLGGLGLIIGTAGLAVMVMRSLRDRRRELELYSALGFPAKTTYRLLAGEFLFILCTGILTGTVSALVGTLPSLVQGGMGVLSLPAEFLGIVLLNGFFWIHFPVRRTMRSIQEHPITR